MIVQTSTTCNPRQFVVQDIVHVLEFLQMQAQSADFRWAEDGEPVEHFFDIIPLKKADAASIYTTLTDWFKQKFNLVSLSEWDLMEQQHFLEPKLESRRYSRRILLEPFMFTVIATCFNLLAFKLPTILLELNMYARH